MNKNMIKVVTNYFVHVCVRACCIMMRLTLNQLLWTLLFIVFVIIIQIRINYKNGDHIDSQNPVIVWWTPGFPGTEETILCSDNRRCDVFSNRNVTDMLNVNAYLFYGSTINFEDLPLPRPTETIWGLFHEESPRNVEELMHEKILNLFNFSSTFSRYSDVPFPLHHLDLLDDITSTEYYVGTSTKNDFLNNISPVMYLQTDCETSSERDDYVKELMKYITIDSYGECLNNKELPQKFKDDYLNNLNEDEFLRFIARYKFVIAIENGVCEDYVTEKFWRAIKVGSVPIYFGSPSVKDWSPNDKTALILEDFPTPEMLSKQIKKLLGNDDLYEEYLEHKTKKIITNERLLRELKERPYQLDDLQTVKKFECYICEQLHDQRHSTSKIVDKSHYDCPKPISALSLDVNPMNPWVFSWVTAEETAERIYKEIIQG